jgi:hypothetical protein
MAERTCANCGGVRPRAEFPSNGRRGYLRPYCRTCQGEQNKRNYMNNRESRLAYQKARDAAAPEAKVARNRDSYLKNREARLAYGKSYRAANPNVDTARRLRRYGLTPERYEQLLSEQGGSCAICRRDDPGKRGWNIDHDHRCCPGPQSCGECVRGILCSRCNTGLGLMGDSPDVLRAAAGYVEVSRG